MPPLIISALAPGLFAIFVSAKGQKQNETPGYIFFNETKTLVFTPKAHTI